MKVLSMFTGKWLEKTMINLIFRASSVDSDVFMCACLQFALNILAVMNLKWLMSGYFDKSCFPYSCHWAGHLCIDTHQKNKG